jgi:hypothetical protein
MKVGRDTKRRGRKTILRKGKVLEVELRSARSHCVEKWLRKRLWTRLKTDYEMND